MKQLIRYLILFLLLFAGFNLQAQNNTVYGAGISYTNGVPTWTPNPRTSRAAVDTVTGRWYHFNTPGGWQWIGNTVEEISGCAAPAYTPSKGDSRLVINNCVKPQVYWYDGTVWKWINEGTTYFAGEGIRIENDTIILDSLNFLDFRTGSALDGDVGRVQWNDTDGTLDLNLKGGNVTLQIGQEEVSLVKHADNSGLIEGRVVYIVGADGANKTVRYAKADSDATSATTFGLMTESASGGGKAFCTTFGLVRDLNTTNLTEGGIVWLSADTAGTMTAVRPTAPDHGVMIGFCVRKHATQGAIFVQVQNGYELNELHDVFAPSPTNGQVLTWNSTNARWEAITPANQLQTLSTDNTPGNISISSGNTITLNVNDADASTTNELQTLSVAANTATLSNSGGSVTIAGAGINTVGTAGTIITVTGTEVDGSTTNELQTLSTGTNTLTLSNGGGTVTVDTDPSTDVTGSGANGQVSYWSGTQTQTGSSSLTYNDTQKSLTLRNSTQSGEPRGWLMEQSTDDVASNLFIMQKRRAGAIQSSNFVGVWDAEGYDGTAYRKVARLGFQAVGTISSGIVPGSILLSTSDNSGALTVRTTINNLGELRHSGAASFGASFAPLANLHVRGSGTSSSTWTAQFHNSAGNNNALMVRDDGNVGIGTNAPSVRLHINGITGDNFRVTNGVRNAYIQTTNNTVSFATGTNGSGGGFSMAGDGSSLQFQASNQQKMLIVGSTGNVIIQNGGTFTDDGINRLQVTGSGKFTGKIEIGTTTSNASAVLEVESTTQGILFPRMTTAQRDLIATPANGLVIYNSTTDKLQVRAAGAWVDLH